MSTTTATAIRAATAGNVSQRINTVKRSATLMAALAFWGAGSPARTPPADPAAPPGQAGLHPFRPAADFFPIVTWDRRDAWHHLGPSAEADLRDAADCGFTVVGFVRPDDLPVCEKLGLAAIVAPAAGQPWFRTWRALSDEDIDRGVRAMVQQAAGSKAVFGYTLMDEPGAAAFPKLARAVAAVDKAAPGKLAHVNLYPSSAKPGAADQSQLGVATYAEYLERFVADVRPQFLSYDNYMVAFSDDLQDAAKGAGYFTNLLEVRRVAERHGLPFWNTVCCNQIRPATPVPSPANLALQAYTTLAAGGRGLTWFRYRQGNYAYAPVDNAGRKTETWRYLQLINRQVRTLGPVLTRLRSTGIYFTAPAPDKVLPVLPGRVVTRVRVTSSPRGLGAVTPGIMVGEFTDETGTDYVMLVNLSLERSANVKFETAKQHTARRTISAEDGRLTPLDGQHGHWLTAGQGVLIRLE
jgi:hypothetical protein